MDLLTAAADGMLEADQRVSTYNRLDKVVHEVIARLTADEPATSLMSLMHHPHPVVFQKAAATYYHELNAQAAEEMSQAIAAAHPESSPLGRAARQTVRSFAFSRELNLLAGTSAVEPPSTLPPPSPTPSPPPPAPVLRCLDRHQLAVLAADSGCEDLLPLLQDIAWSSLRLQRTHMEADDLPIGASKLGGCPDLPPSVGWPRFRSNPLSFVGQIDLAEIAPYRGFTYLPASGLLSFYYDADLQSWGIEDLEPGSVRVIYVAPGDALARRAAPDDLYEELRLRPAKLAFVEDLTLPGYDIGPMSEDPDAPLPELTSEQFEALERLNEAVSNFQSDDNQPRHRMFGFPDGWQDSMHIQWEFERGKQLTEDDVFRMVLQIDSDQEADPAMFWGSGGRIHFWVNRAALLQGEFDAAQLVLQST